MDILRTERTVEVRADIAADGTTVMFIPNEKGGPIVMGKSVEEASEKMDEALEIYGAMISFMNAASAHLDNKQMPDPVHFSWGRRAVA